MQDHREQRTALVGVEPDRFSNQWYRAGLVGSSLVLVYAISVVAYFAISGAVLVDPLQIVYPGVWFGVLGGGFILTTPRKKRSVWGVVVSGGFVAGLLVVSGLLDIGTAGNGMTIGMAMPGWGPVVGLELFVGSLTIIPFQTAGYVGLGVLLYRAMGNTTKSILPGVVSVFSCAGCLGWIGVTLIGVSGASSAWIIEYSYPLATVAFIATVGLFSYYALSAE